MRKSFSEFIETCSKIKCLLQLSSYEIYQYDDASFSDFHVPEIKYPKQLNSIIGSLMYRIFQGDRGIVIRVFENYVEDQKIHL